MQIHGKTFLITGGCSGLGAACVRMVAQDGGNVVIADLNKDKGEALAAELGARTRFVATDVTGESSVQHAVRTAEEVFGGLHGSIQCAGVAIAERVLGKSGPHSLAAFVKVITVNLVGAAIIGLLAGLIASGRLQMSAPMRTFVFVGILGGFTTFSSYMLDTLTLSHGSEQGMAVLNVAGQTILGFAAAWAGYYVGAA